MAAAFEDSARTADHAGSVVDISVIIPAYNAEQTLGEQLSALRAQRPRVEWEVLVCDNGSGDGTRDLVSDLARDWPELRLVDASQRRGAGAARNIGAQVARGELLLFCDADDVIGDGWLEAMTAALRQHTLVAGRLEWSLLNSSSPMRLSLTVQDRELFTKWFMPGLPAAGSGNLGVRRGLFLGLDGFCEVTSTGEDVDFCWRAQLAGQPLIFVPESVMHVRKRDTLKGVWRQGFAYGRGDKWLMQRFAGVSPHQRSGASPSVEESVGSAPGHRGWRVWSRRVRRLLTARRPGDFADWAFTLSFALGTRFGLFRPPPELDLPIAEVQA